MLFWKLTLFQTDLEAKYYKKRKNQNRFLRCLFYYCLLVILSLYKYSCFLFDNSNIFLDCHFVFKNKSHKFFCLLVNRKSLHCKRGGGVFNSGINRHITHLDFFTVYIITHFIKVATKNSRVYCPAILLSI